MNLAQIAGPLRKLTPRQEKVVRLYYGLGCQRPHSAAEVAQAFGLRVQAIAGILGGAQRSLAAEGLSSRQLREVNRQASERRQLGARSSLQERPNQ